MKLIRSLAVYLYLALAVVIGALYYNHLGKKKETLGEQAFLEKVYAYARTSSRRILALTGSRITVQGQENLPQEETVLYVANHQSYMDIPVVMSIVERPLGFVAKEGLGKIPFMSKWFLHMKCVLIARGDTRKALTAILQAAKYLKEGHTLVLFPEGTRSVDGTLGEFKAGSLKMAQKGKVAIVPLALQNPRDILARNQVWVHKADVTVTVLPKIPAETVQTMDTKELAMLVRGQIAQALGQELPAETGDELDG